MEFLLSQVMIPASECDQGEACVRWLALRSRSIVRAGVGLGPHQPPIEIKALELVQRCSRPLALGGAPESPQAQPAVSTRMRLRLWATRTGAITGWLTVDAQFEPTAQRAGTGPLRHAGLTSTYPGSRPGHAHANSLAGSNGTWSRIT